MGSAAQSPTDVPTEKGLLAESGSAALAWWDHEANDRRTLPTVTVRATRTTRWRCPACERATRRVADTPGYPGLPLGLATLWHARRLMALDRDPPGRPDMAKRTRRDCAQVMLRMTPSERARIQRAVPRGSLNAVAIQLLMDYARALEGGSPLAQEGSAA